MEAAEVARDASLKFASGYIERCVTDFKSRGLLDADFVLGEDDPDDGILVRLTATGIELAEDWEEAIATQTSADSATDKTPIATATPRKSAEQTGTGIGAIGESSIGELAVAEIRGVPASDRMVSLNDNQKAFNEFHTNLVELIQALNSGEQDTNLSSEDILVVRGQLEAARRLVEASPDVTVAALMSVLIPPVKFLAGCVTAGIIGNKATAILDFLLTFVS